MNISKETVPAEQDLTPADFWRQGLRLLAVFALVVAGGCLVGWLLDDSHPTWIKRAQTPNLDRPDVARLLRRARWEHSQATIKEVRQENGGQHQ